MADEFLPRPVADTFARRVAPPELYDPVKRREWKLGRTDADRGPYVIEYNLQHIEGLAGAIATLEMLLAPINKADPPRTEYISKTYSRVKLTVDEWQRLLAADEEEAKQRVRQADSSISDAKLSPSLLFRYRAIYKLWPDFPVYSHIYKSAATIKSDASARSYGASGSGIVWAVVDSGIDGTHSHFDLRSGHTLDSPEVHDLHRCFIDTEGTIEGIPFLAPAPADPDALARPGRDATEDQLRDFQQRRRELLNEHRTRALTDDFGHGTHVAGIIAGAAKADPVLLERAEQMNGQGEGQRGGFEKAGSVDGDRLRGMAPDCRLISLRVLNSQGEGRSSHVIRALAYIHERLNDNPKLLRVHGVNLSVGYEFDAEMFACGQSPICAEVNRLVQSGVVVVAAAGNTGFGTVAASARPTKVGLSNTINDPGNAELAITVGATHRDSPYTYGVSYFSSKGPTGDGRLKPDLVAPGERITSCGAGRRLKKVTSDLQLPDGTTYYMEDSGTSMAAPHVSGAIAAFLSIRREFIGKPLDVKRIFLSTASPLGRERYFEGHGLIDLIRAIQSV